MAAPILQGGHQYGSTNSYGGLHQGDHYGDTHNYAPKESRLNKILRNLVSISGRDEIITQYTRRRVEGTCDWLITVPDSYYLAWRESNKSDGLWVSGKPGKGKTMLAVHLFNHLRKSSSDGDVLLYFFCKNEHGDRNKTDVILRDLSNQLLHREPGLVDHIRAYFSPAPQAGNPPICNTTYATIFETLVHNSASSITCVLDGLDECDESETKVEEFLKLLGDIARKTPSSSSTRNFKLLIISRDWPPCINRQLGWCQRINLDEAEEKTVENDVEKYIAQKLQELAVEHEQYRLPEHRLEQVRQVLTDKSDGTFLWAGYVADEIKGKTWIEVNNILMRVPKGLDGLYLRMLRAIKDRAQDSVGTEMVTSILQWVVLSQRPLTIDELAAATKPVDSDQLSHEETVSDVLKLCGRFFQVGDTINFLHQSARDYLLQGKDKFGDNDLAVLLVDEKRGHAALANTCLTHVETGFQTPSSRGPLFNYATIYWPKHLRHVSATTEEVLDLSRPFWHRRSAIWENWSRAYSIERDGWVFARPCFTPMQFAAYFGMVPLVEKLIRINSKLDAIGHDERTPFLCAAEMGHEKVATMLLKKGANVNAADSYGRTALHWATIAGHKSMMVKLLGSGARLESRESGGGTLLARAVDNGCPDVIEILLNGGAKVNYLYVLPLWLDNSTGANGSLANFAFRHDLFHQP
ncbi:hypothetical protein EDB80DRAFT_891022 [Ilyonectria destructans]|nr:hypothetical protein EDB80DRAFT_891022 [Ilyonectria destructans]